MHNFDDVKIILDSVNEDTGKRITTFQISIWKLILAELNTHRQFCLDEDSLIYFDRPVHAKNGKRSVYKIPIKLLYEKWTKGAERKNGVRVEFTNNLESVEKDVMYTTAELADILQVNRRIITRLCSLNKVLHEKNGEGKQATFYIRGRDFISFVKSREVERFCLKSRISNMLLRSLNEETLEFYNTSIKDVMYSGEKEVFEILLENNKKIRCTKHHLLFTEDGYKTLEDLGVNRGEVVSWSKDAPKIATNGFEIDVDFIIKERDGGKSLKQIAKENSIKEKTLRTFCEKRKIKFQKIISTPNEQMHYLDSEWLRDKKIQGFTNGYIATLCNTTEDRIKKACRKFGLRGYIGKVLKDGGRRVPWNKNKTYKHNPSTVERLRNNPNIWKSGSENPNWKGGIEKYKSLNTQVIKFLSDIRGDIFKIYDYKCALTGSNKDLEMHHIDPVWHNKGKALDKNNIILLCKKVHRFIHKNNLDLEFMSAYHNGDLSMFMEKYKDIKICSKDIKKPVSSGNPLVCRFSKIKEIKYIGIKKCYDIEVAGPYHNFVADGIVVHNSKNAGSSRAVPSKKMREMVLKSPFMPIHWGRNQRGMQAEKELSGYKLRAAKLIWRSMAKIACFSHWMLEKAGLHKQVCNRLIEPWLAANVVITSTDYDNFFRLRDHKDAQPEIRDVAHKMKLLYDSNEPKVLAPGEWHIPYLFEDEKLLPTVQKLRISAGRCARVSYYYHDGQKSSWEQDLNICKRLMASEPQHSSPFEHQAQASDMDERSGNFSGGWIQHRKLVESGINPYAKWD